jgi:hypothetical protein
VCEGTEDELIVLYGLGGYKCTTYEEILIVRGDADDIDKRVL